MKCKGCKALIGAIENNDIIDYSNAKCGLLYDTVLIDGTMHPEGDKCNKPRSLIEFDRLRRIRVIPKEKR